MPYVRRSTKRYQTLLVDPATGRTEVVDVRVGKTIQTFDDEDAAIARADALNDQSAANSERQKERQRLRRSSHAHQAPS